MLLPHAMQITSMTLSLGPWAAIPHLKTIDIMNHRFLLTSSFLYLKWAYSFFFFKTCVNNFIWSPMFKTLYLLQTRWFHFIYLKSQSSFLTWSFCLSPLWLSYNFSSMTNVLPHQAFVFVFFCLSQIVFKTCSHISSWSLFKCY
jgi:hypothetical protein